MTFIHILLSKKALISIALIVLFPLLLTLFPLIGTLGFEFSLGIAFLSAFIAVFISSKFVNLDLRARYAKERRFSDLVSSIFVFNLLLISVPFVIGFLSSVIRDDCYIREGTIFYVLIPVITVFFSCCLGLLVGTLFPKRGFLLSSFIIIAIVCFSLWRLYSEPPIFSYNPIFGFLPGPLYDESIPLTSTLVIYRLISICWGLFFLVFLNVIKGFKYQTVRIGDFFALFILILILVVSHVKEEELGVSYTRKNIKENFLTGSIETEHFVIYYMPGTPEANMISLIANDHEWRYKELKEFLKVNSNDKIYSYIYPDIATRKRLIGAGETTIANPIHGEIHLVYDVFPDTLLKHELTHVMSSEFGIKLLRISPKVGLIEGLAVAADWEGVGYTPHQWAEAMFQTNTSLKIKDILGLGFWEAPPAKSYILMGSFVRYLIDTYGIENFKNLYRTGRFKIYGKSVDELISEWREFLEDVYVSQELLQLAQYKFRQPGIFQGRCPRRIATLTDKGLRAFKDENFYEARKFFNEALGLNKNDPAITERLAYTYYFDKDYNELTDLIGKSQGLKEVDKNILENLRGNALWQSERIEEATTVFNSILQKPLPEDIRREIEIKLSAISTGGYIEKRIREYFSTKEELYQVMILEEIIRDFPDYSSAYYLLGRLVFNDEDYTRAKSPLLESESLGLPSERLKIENLRILGISLFATGDYEGAIERFQSILNLEPEGVLKEYAVDFIARSGWVRNSGLK
jgi:tetratricopeptide (TPR) repeat protein